MVTLFYRRANRGSAREVTYLRLQGKWHKGNHSLALLPPPVPLERHCLLKALSWPWMVGPQ